MSTPELRRRGVFLPTSLLVTLVMSAAGVGMAYIFATKAEVAQAAKESDDRIIVLEQVTKHHDDALDDLKKGLEAVDENLRDMMLEQGVHPKKAWHKEKP